MEYSVTLRYGRSELAPRMHRIGCLRADMVARWSRLACGEILGRPSREDPTRTLWLARVCTLGLSNHAVRQAFGQLIMS